jgi:hypothetical protein
MKFFKDGKILSEVNKIKILPTTSKNKIWKPRKKLWEIFFTFLKLGWRTFLIHSDAYRENLFCELTKYLFSIN